MKTKQELKEELVGKKLKYKDTIFGNHSSICERYLNELQEQGKINQCMRPEILKEYWVRDICNALVDAVEEDWMLIDRKTDGVIRSIVDNTYLKKRF